MQFTTEGMTYYERLESFENGNVIPIGTICFKAGDWLSDTEKIIVDENNQRIISMLWNSSYFLDKNKADGLMYQSKAEYERYLYGYMSW